MIYGGSAVSSDLVDPPYATALQARPVLGRIHIASQATMWLKSIYMSETATSDILDDPGTVQGLVTNNEAEHVYVFIGGAISLSGEKYGYFFQV